MTKRDVKQTDSIEISDRSNSENHFSIDCSEGYVCLNLTDKRRIVIISNDLTSAHTNNRLPQLC